MPQPAGLPGWEFDSIWAPQPPLDTEQYADTSCPPSNGVCLPRIHKPALRLKTRVAVLASIKDAAWKPRVQHSRGFTSCDKNPPLLASALP